MATPGPVSFRETGSTAVAADGAAHADRAGVALVVPPEVVEEGRGVQLIASEGAGWVIDQLAAVARAESAFYRVVADGDRDTTGSVELRFPAASAGSRVAAIVDGFYLFVYAVEPQDGSLSIRVPAPPAQPADLGGDPMGAPGDIRYVVIGPAAGVLPGRAIAAVGGFGAFDAAAPGANRWCVVFGDIPVELRTCRMNAAGSVQVSWGRSDLISEATADAVIRAAENGMSRYAALGLTAAKISALEPVKVVVRPGDDSPLYNSTLGVVRMGAVAAGKIATDAMRFELWHELFHWVEDEAYAMFWGFVNSDLKWWLETSAEVGGFLVDSGAAEYNASLYGRSSLDDLRTLVFQLSPFVWVTQEQYVQAHLLRANICPAGCPLTIETFVAAINAGTYPMQGGAMRAAVRSNLDRYVTYVMTGQLDGADTVAPFKTGTVIGDYVAIGGADNAPFAIDTNSYPPQVDKTRQAIEAPLQPYSIYPLWVASGPVAGGATGTTVSVGQPAMLTVASGTELYYRLDGGPVKHHDGATPLVIAPIQMYLGHAEVRIVAVARKEAATFKAKLEPIDLTGDWLFSMKTAKVVSNSCPSEDDDGDDPSTDEDLLTTLGRFAAVRGSYGVRDERLPGELEYVLDPGKTFKDKPSDPEVTYEATVTVEDKQVLAHIFLDSGAAGEASGGGPDPAWLLAAAPAGLLVLRRRRLSVARWMPMVLAASVAAALVAGCAGIGLSGTITSDLAFTRLEYLGPDAPDDKPQWRLSSGKGDISLDLTTVVTIVDADGDETSDTQRCQMEVALTAVGDLYRDGVVEAPAE